MNKWDLLPLLAGEYISGEEIAKKFNVTRAAVWKSVTELKKLGYDIESKTNNGYKLLPPSYILDILNEYEIKRRLEKKNLDYSVIYKTSTDSTNNDAKKITGKNDKYNIIIAAEKQTAGKGRYGRGFYAENNHGIYFTIKINSGLSIDDITFFPLIAAAAVSQAVQELCGIELLRKWPNDLLCKTNNKSFRKLCGILTEASIEAESRSVSYVIVGIGLNVNNDISDFPDDLKDIASSLKIISGEKYDRADIMCTIAEHFTRLMNLPRADLLAEYKKRLLLDIGMSFTQNGEILKGIARNITETGNLTAELENGEITVIQSGEIKFI